ncbi:hypothetical protein E4U42_003491 [Claviceps africana]|uniref:Yippee domain-containing protein n=1 Tax=Claviceps africana TaxID=83212 RepID=A0A8K0J7A1_9HYPO|nr:hypothetical protein E4U42_003491 [Claviceps africana]
MARRRTTTTSISATRPVFPNYLLSSFNFVFHRRKSTSPPPSDDRGPAPVHHGAPHNPSENKKLLVRRLSRAAPDTLRCRSCSTDVALASQILSKGFTGRYGRAFLIAPAPAPAPAAPGGPAAQSLLNIRTGRSEDRQLVTGWHVVADICCATCSWKLGWKYVDAREPSQRYKVGKYILEAERVVTHRSWEDFAVDDLGLVDGGSSEDGDGGRRGRDDVGSAGRGSLGDSDQIVFDSDDDEECEDIFSGTWDAATVAKRRSQAVARVVSLVV